jgi:hypothetical protein
LPLPRPFAGRARKWRTLRQMAVTSEVFVAETDAEACRLSVGDMMGRMMAEYFLPLLASFGFLPEHKISGAPPCN